MSWMHCVTESPADSLVPSDTRKGIEPSASGSPSSVASIVTRASIGPADVTAPTTAPPARLMSQSAVFRSTRTLAARVISSSTRSTTTTFGQIESSR